jgi:hypothetical protein
LTDGHERSCAPRPSPVHSAHVGQHAVVHYRWHALFGRRVRIERADNRKAGRFVHVEVLPGVVTVVAAWMLDASACVGMEIGAPRASLAALQDLDDLLKRRGLRRSCSGDIAAREEQPDARPADEAFATPTTADRAGLDAAARNEPARSASGRDAPRDPADGSGRGRGGRGAGR